MVMRNRVRRTGFALALTLGAMSAVAVSGQGAGTAGAAGAPIKIINISMVTSPVYGQPSPETPATIKAAASVINAAGGLDGHPIKVIVCDDKGNLNDAANCAREAVSDGVVAAVGDNSPTGTAIDPILESAGIATIGPNPLSATDLSSPNSFTVQSGFLTVTGAAVALEQAGAKRIETVTIAASTSAEVSAL